MEKEDLPIPFTGAIFFENEVLYACVANYPIAKGHCVVVWKDDLADLHLLTEADYVLLMEAVEQVRCALLDHYQADKVYLLYMDEIKHVHWHLIPRTGKDMGFTLLEHNPKLFQDKLLAEALKKKMKGARV